MSVRPAIFPERAAGHVAGRNAAPPETNETDSRPFASDKIFAHADRVREWLKTGRSRPVTVELDMTNVCNQKCPHCFGFYPKRDQARLCLDAAKDILRQVSALGVRGLTFTGGGDPTTNPATPEVVAYAVRLGLDVGFITNAQKLSPKMAAVILRHCVWVRVSVDAASPRVFRKTHGMGPEQFARVLGGVRLLTRLKKKLGSRTTVGIGFLTSNETKEDIYAFGRLGKSLEVDYAQYRPLLRRHGKADVDYSDAEVLGEMLRAQRDFADEGYKVVCSEHKYREIAAGRLARRYRECYGQHFATVIGADRKMYVCCHMRGVKKYAIGDFSRQTLEEIWFSEKRQRVAKSVDFKDCPPLCRCDSFNNVLWDLKQAPQRFETDAPEKRWQHKNFI